MTFEKAETDPATKTLSLSWNTPGATGPRAPRCPKPQRQLLEFPGLR
jgi:hypothetical protein